MEYVLNMVIKSENTNIEYVKGNEVGKEEKEELEKVNEKMYRMYINRDIERVNLEIKAEDELAKVVYIEGEGEGNEENIVEGNIIEIEKDIEGEITELRVKVESEYGTEKEYKIQAIKKSNNNETIKGEKILTNDFGLGAYSFVMIENMSDITSNMYMFK